MLRVSGRGPAFLAAPPRSAAAARLSRSPSSSRGRFSARSALRGRALRSPSLAACCRPRARRPHSLADSSVFAAVSAGSGRTTPALRRDPMFSGARFRPRRSARSPHSRLGMPLAPAACRRGRSVLRLATVPDPLLTHVHARAAVRCSAPTRTFAVVVFTSRFSPPASPPARQNQLLPLRAPRFLASSAARRRPLLRSRGSRLVSRERPRVHPRLAPPRHCAAMSEVSKPARRRFRAAPRDGASRCKEFSTARKAGAGSSGSSPGSSGRGGPDTRSSSPRHARSPALGCLLPARPGRPISPGPSGGGRTSCSATPPVSVFLHAGAYWLMWDFACRAAFVWRVAQFVRAPPPHQSPPASSVDLIRCTCRLCPAQVSCASLWTHTAPRHMTDGLRPRHSPTSLNRTLIPHSGSKLGRRPRPRRRSIT